MPVISIIVPVYNVKKYLERCVDSILNQSLTDFELLLVDDGSNDGSGELCDELAKKDQRIKVIHKQNGGVSDARNKGLSIASGEYVTFIDSDDWIAQDMIERLYKGIVEDGSDISLVRIKRFSMNESEIPVYYNKKKVLSSRDAINFLLALLDERTRQSVAKLIRIDIARNHPFPLDRKWSEDTAVVYKWYSDAKQITIMDDQLYFYFESRENSASNSGLRYRTDEYRTMMEMLNFLKNNEYDYLYKKCVYCFTEALASYCEKTQRLKSGNKDKALCLYTFRKQLRKILKHHGSVIDWSDAHNRRYYALAYYPHIWKGYWTFRGIVGHIKRYLK